MSRNRLAAITLLVLCFFSVPFFQPINAFLGNLGHTPISDPHAPIRVLFIGNSYTFYNNLPQLVTALARNEARPLQTDSITKGGATLKQHWQDGQVLNAIRQGRWDYVVLQEHSTLGPNSVVNGVAQLSDPTDFYTYARKFDAEIQKTGAKTIFYMTWARRNAPQNQAILSKDYLTIATELHAIVAPVGVAWASVLQAKPSLVLHQDDMSHPNSTGSYLAACVFYATIYHKSPVGLTSHILDTSASSRTSGDVDGQKTLVNLDKANASFLQTAAWQTVTQQGNLTAQPARTAIEKVSYP